MLFDPDYHSAIIIVGRFPLKKWKLGNRINAGKMLESERIETCNCSASHTPGLAC